MEDGNGQASQSYVSVMLNNGSGVFTTLAQYSTGTALNYVAMADFNGDGNLDLGVTSDAVTYVFSGLGGGSFASPAAYAGGGGQPAIVAAQFNNGGVPDIALVASDDLSLSLLLNTTGTHFTVMENPNPSAYFQPVGLPPLSSRPSLGRANRRAR